jgi:hypothetical protein
MKPLLYWSPNGFEISSYKNSLKQRINQTYTMSGGDTSGKCIYTYNELGFRGDSIKKEGFKIMSLGCSITEGVGVNDNETWPAAFCKHIDKSVNMNFGAAGQSNDFIARCLISYYDLIKPDLVLIMYTFPHRREIYTQNNFIESYLPTKVWSKLLETKDDNEIQNSMDFLQNDNEDVVNWYKNHLLIKYFLESKKCNWLWNGNFGIPLEYTEFNRFSNNIINYYIDTAADDCHPGALSHDKYSINLYNYIYKNFKQYLPTKSKEAKPSII